MLTTYLWNPGPFFVRAIDEQVFSSVPSSTLLGAMPEVQQPTSSCGPEAVSHIARKA